MRLSFPATFALTIAALVLILFQVHDPDLWWHLKAGEVFFTTRSIPETDLFSHTAAGQPWFVQGWIADIAMWWVWDRFGVLGLRVVAAVLALGIWWFVYRSVRLYAERAETAVLISAASLVLAVLALAPRPMMVTALFDAVVLHALLVYRVTGRLCWLAVLPPVFAVWPNIHFGFVTGFGIIGLFVVSDGLSRWFPINGERLEPGSLTAPAAWLFIALSVVAVGANPHGFGVYPETIQMAAQNSAARVAEWQSPTFSGFFGKAFCVSVCAFLVLRGLVQRPLAWLDLVTPVVMIAIGYSAVRHLPAMAIVLAPFLARAFPATGAPPIFRAPRHGTPTAHRVLEAARTDLSPAVSSAINAVMVAGVVCAAMFVAPKYEAYKDKQAAEMQPRGASDFILDHKLEGRMFNTYNGGGYLIYRLYPFQKVFIDGRYNPYPKSLIDDYFAITDGDADWFETLERYAVDIVVCESSAPLRQMLLLRPEFRLVYADEAFSVLVRDAARFENLATVQPLAPDRKRENARH